MFVHTFYGMHYLHKLVFYVNYTFLIYCDEYICIMAAFLGLSTKYFFLILLN